MTTTTSGAAVPTSTPAGARLAWLLDALSGRVPLEPVSAAEQLAASFTQRLPARQLVASLLDTAHELGALVVERVDAVSPYEISARVVSSGLALWVVRLAVDPQPPHGIASVSLTPARLPTEAGCSVPVPWDEVADAQPVARGTLSGGLTDRVGQLLVEAREQARQPALLAGVSIAGAPALTWAGGFAEVATGRRPGRRNAVRAAGLSRTVTALTVLSLVDEGQVELEAPVGDHLRRVGLAGPGRPVTVADLLRHTSGLLPQPATVTGVRTGSHLPTPVELYAPALVADLPPGRVVVADENTALAGLLVEDVTGRPFAEEAVGRVLDPLGMTHSSYRLDDRVAKQPVCGYDVDFDEIAVTPGTEVVLEAAHGLVSTLDDLLALGAAVAGPDGARLSDGLGVFAVPGSDVLWQAGGWPGAVSALAAVRGGGLAVVVHGNAFTGGRAERLVGLAVDVLDLVTEEVGR
jgi:D-alanyl-D-alanine carboxypeptidase